MQVKLTNALVVSAVVALAGCDSSSVLSLSGSDSRPDNSRPASSGTVSVFDEYIAPARALPAQPALNSVNLFNNGGMESGTDY